MNQELTQQILRQHLRYEPDTGRFIWLVKTAIRTHIGQQAGSLDRQQGYRKLSVCGKAYKEHRLAFFYMTGEWPKGEVDHVDGNRSNNCWSNLRDVTHQFNATNRRKAQPSNKSTGLLGAARNHNRFVASIVVHGRKINLGNYKTPEEAHSAYVAAKRLLHPGCTI